MDVSLRQIRSVPDDRPREELHWRGLVLNVTQPALTMQIRRLEEALGVTLFDRDTRSVELHPCCARSPSGFERTLQDFDAALGQRSRHRDSKARNCQIGCVAFVSLRSCPTRSCSFATRPNVIFDLKDVIAGQVLNLVRVRTGGFRRYGRNVKAVGVETVFEAQDRLHVVYPEAIASHG